MVPLIPMLLNIRSGRKHSSKSHWRTTPVSSRSFIVNLPFGFELVQRSLMISCGHSMRHTMYPMSSVIPIQTPPTPVPQASL